MSRRESRARAQAILEAWVSHFLGPMGPEDTRTPLELSQAIADAEGKLNRATRRALGARGDGRYHPLASLKTVPRTRNAR